MLHCARSFAFLGMGLAMNLRNADQHSAASPKKVRVQIYMEPGCPHCQDYIAGPLKAALGDEATAKVMDLDINAFGNSFYAIPECHEAALSNAQVPGCGGAGGYDVGRRTCFNQKCGPDSPKKDRPKDCFGGSLVFQFGFLQMYPSRYLVCAKKLAQDRAHPWKKYAPFFVCMEEKFHLIHDGASTSNVANSCAKQTGYDMGELDHCATNEADNIFLEEAVTVPDHEGVPWVVINGAAQEETYSNDALIEAVQLASQPSLLSIGDEVLQKTHDSNFVRPSSHRNITC